MVRVILLLDWQTAAPNDTYNDLGAIALFFRLGARIMAIRTRTHERESAAVVSQSCLLQHIRGQAY